MRIFLAGATGVIGRQVLPLLLAEGHEVTATTRTPSKVESLHAAGAEPVLLDALDGAAVKAALDTARPETVIHLLTALPKRMDPRKIERDFLLNDRLRSEGTRLLIAAAQEAGVQRVIAQSIAFMYAAGPPGTVHGEQDPLVGEQASKQFRRTARAVEDLEATVLAAAGVVLRFGYFYGPGSGISSDGSVVQEVTRRRLPIVGRGEGVWSFVHIADAARATVAALDQEGPAIFNIVDDEPAPVAQWVPELAAAVGAKRPLRIPEALARVLAGDFGVETLTRSQGASNALAREKLSWEPQHPSWREGFHTALG
jgi:nucleoside-diphosphate-sugar epimerase